MSTVNQQSRQRRALAHVERRIEIWEQAKNETLSVYPGGFDRDADPSQKLDQALAEKAALTHNLRGIL